MKARGKGGQGIMRGTRDMFQRYLELLEDDEAPYVWNSAKLNVDDEGVEIFFWFYDLAVFDGFARMGAGDWIFQ